MSFLSSIRQARHLSTLRLISFSATRPVLHSATIDKTLTESHNKPHGRFYHGLFNRTDELISQSFTSRICDDFPGHVRQSYKNSVMKGDVSSPSAVSFRSFIHSASRKEFEMGRNSNSMNFVKGIIEEDGKGSLGGPQLPQQGAEANLDIVHIKLMRNNTFVTVTDAKGNKKIGASSGCLPEMKKGGAKLSRYAAEATAEHAGRLARNLGLKSVVMKVNGYTFFKKKRQAIMSWKDGFTYSRGDQNPIVYIEDTTRRPHNGCRLPKKRRV